MLADHEITRDELFAVGATFTLVAWAFAYAYTVCQAIEPGSFTAAVDPSGQRTLDGAAVPQLHDALQHRPQRRRPGQAVRARARDDRAARRASPTSRCSSPGSSGSPYVEPRDLRVVVGLPGRLNSALTCTESYSGSGSSSAGETRMWSSTCELPSNT